MQKKISKILAVFLLIEFSCIFFVSANDEIFFGQGPKEKIVALTFDDGPGKSTETILAILKKYNVRATFFMEASQIPIRPKIAQMVLAQGEEIGSHTYSHPNFWVYKKDDKKEVLSKELDKAEQVMQKTLNFKPKLLRMPYGFVRPWVREVAREKGYKIISWTFGCDWLKLKKETLVHMYLKNLMPGAIFLMHDGGGKLRVTAEALPMIIEGIQAKGYKIVTVSEMFNFEENKVQGPRK